ncbi:MAG: response regulator [Deltaproteobacteria bacterium]|nr:response regulator [Deltaproteobacteria bacterium]
MTVDGLAILDRVPNGCVAVDEEFRITFLNTVMERRTGLRRTEVVGKQIYDVFPRLASPRHRIRIDETMRFGVPTLFSPLLNRDLFVVESRGEERASHSLAPARERFEQVTVTRTAPGSSDAHILLFTVVDVTELHGRGERFRQEARARQQRERELRVAMEKAETATRAKSLFLASMSHELRTPMNAVLGMCELLLQSELTPAQREDMQLIQTSGSSLLALLNDILDFSKIEAQKLAIEEIAFDPRRVVEESVCMMAEMAHGKDVDCVSVVAPDVPDEVVGDPTRFRQVLTNLLSNAMKFTSSGQIVARLHVELDGDKLRLFCAVEDTGPGMSAETCARLFEPFVQARASTSRLHGGTGLGLSICRRLVHLMNGEISAESVVGRGSTFRFDVLVRPREVDELRRAQPHTVGICVAHGPTAESLSAQLQSRGIRRVETVSLEEITRGEPLAHLTHLFVDSRAAAAHDRARQEHPGETGPRRLLVARVSTASRAARESGDTLFVPCTRAAVDRLLGVETARTPQVDWPSLGLDILVAEDNRTNQIVARGLLKKLGCTFTFADDGSAAVAAALGKRYDVVLMDVQMPEMDGLEATRRLREVGYQGTIIALTASALSEDREACSVAGMNDFLAKPIDRRALVEALERWCSRKAA